MALHRAWRLKYDSDLRGYTSCATLALRSVSGGADITQGAPGIAIADSAYSGYGAALAFDNNIATFWSSNANGGTGYIGWDFGAGQTRDVVEFAFTARNDTYSDNDSPRSGGLEYSDDLITWTRLFSIPTPQAVWGVSETRVFTYVAPGPIPPQINQVALIIPLNETPPLASGANINQIAIISVGKEYEITRHLHGWLIQSIWGFPLYIQRGSIL